MEKKEKQINISANFNFIIMPNATFMTIFSNNHKNFEPVTSMAILYALYVEV